MFLSSISLVCIISSLFVVQGCVYPTGLGTNPGEIDPDTLDFSDGIFPSFGPLAGPTIESTFETPIQFELFETEIIPIFNSLAAFDSKSLDHFGREIESEQRRRCSDIDSDLFNTHRLVSYAYSVYFNFAYTLPSKQEDFASVINSFGLNSTICDDESNCQDISTPWGLAYTLLGERILFDTSDGWNRDGSLSRQYNKIPYSDFRKKNKYIPKNNPWELKYIENWQPLLESDENGFLFYQEHVTPHIGFTGRSIFLGDKKICKLQSYEPNYDYETEISLALQRLALLTDEQKMLIEFFDTKGGSLIPIIQQYTSRVGLIGDTLESLIYTSILLNSVYEGTIVVWKEKIRFDKIRPPSIIHHLLDEQYITSYAGRNTDGETYGTQTFLANDFEPYIRTMPHAEYPSASACICESFAQAMIYFTGSNNFTETIGGPIEINFDAYSSELEPLSTPKEDIQVLFHSWTEISDYCAQSRLDGGMHFTESIYAGQTLCADIGKNTAMSFKDILNGIKPHYVFDFKDTINIPNRKCYY